MNINARVLGWTDTCCGCSKLIGKDEKVYIINDLLGVSGGIHLCEDCISKITESQGIKLKNIDLTGISKYEQWEKMSEEESEFVEAFIEYENNKTEANRNHLLEEFFDTIQSALGVLEKEGIKAEEVQAYYPKHIEKIEKRNNKPREKKCSKCKKTFCKKICEGRINENYAKECKSYEEQEE